MTSAEKISECKYVRVRVTTLTNKVTSQLSSYSATDRASHISALQKLQVELHELNKAVYLLRESEGADDVELGTLIQADEEYDEKIEQCVHALRGMSAANLTQNSSSILNATHSSLPNGSKIPLPKLELPTFANKKDESLKKFLDTFEAILAKTSSSDRELFLYLRNQLSGGPRTLVDSLDSSQESYIIAKELLEKAFDCALTNKFTLVQRMANLKLQKSTDPYSFIGEVRSIMSGMKSSDLKLEDVQQYFVWKAMNPEFQSHLVNITN